MDATAAVRGATVEDAMVDRVIAIVTRRLRTERGIPECRGDVSLNVRGRVRRNEHAFLLRVTRDAQRLAESGVTRAIELHEADGASVDEVTHGEPVPLALAVCERHGDLLSQRYIVGRLQVPVQWLLEPVDVVLRHL